MEAATLLVNFLKQEGLLAEEPGEALFSGSDCQPVQALVKQGLLNEADALEKIAMHLDLENLNLEDPVVKSRLDVARFSSRVKPQLCWANSLVPLYEEAGTVVVAQANPFDFESHQAIGFALSQPTRAVIAPEWQIRALLNQYLSESHEALGLSGSDDEDLDLVVTHSTTIDQSVDIDDGDSAPVVRLVNRILIDAVTMEASDIHIEPTQVGVNVRFRIDGVMHKIIEIPKRLQRFVLTRMKLLSGMDIAERRKPQDGRLRIEHAGKSVDMRVSCIPIASGEKLVLRLLRDDYSSLTLGSLGFGAELLSSFQRALGHDSKLVIVTGPTGSGKTTTLYTALNHLHDGKRNITTVEDPIEYRFGDINQVQVNSAVGVTFPSALRSILRQDPDVIMIGEIRDQETAHIAVQAAQTGHLVLSTLHTNSAPDAITRLFDLGVEPYAVASSLAGVLAQRLVRKICDDCSATVENEALGDHEEYIQRYGIDLKTLRRGHGCPQCNNTGFQGRLGVYSYLEINDTMAGMIQSGSSARQLAEYARQRGYCPLDEAVIALVKSGVTTFSEALPHLISWEEVESVEEVPGVVPIPTTETSKSPQAGLQKGKVMIVDDSLMARRFVAMAIKDEFVEVIEAENGSDALQLLHEQIPDLILCDIQMPVMDGIEFLKKVRQKKATRDIPVLMLTAESDPDVEADLLEMGANDFVCKDGNQRVILTRIRRFVGDI